MVFSLMYQLQVSELHDVLLQDMELHDVLLHDVELQDVPLHEVPLHEVESQPELSDVREDQDVEDQDVEFHRSPSTSTSPLTRSSSPSPSGSAYTWRVPRLSSIEPRPLEGTSPWFAGAYRYFPVRVAFTAPYASTSPDPDALPRELDLSAVPISVAFATSGVSDGSAWNMRAATPETIAAAWEVPVPLK
jgi:hypothetical protein